MAALPPAAAATLPDRRASIRELDRAIVNLAGRINAATHDFLVLIRRFDERAGWAGWRFETCAEWLAWRCDMSRSAAREKVRVAHALKTLPAIGRAFAEGVLSYSKVRALTRVAGLANEDELLAFALTTTAARVEERCRELRCGTAASLAEAVRARARRGLSSGVRLLPRGHDGRRCRDRGRVLRRLHRRGGLARLRGGVPHLRGSAVHLRGSAPPLRGNVL